MKFLTYNGLMYFWGKIKEELDSLKSSVSNGKKVVANAITDKGVNTAEDATFATMAENISNIQTGVDTTDATAKANEILYGKTAYVNEVKVTGSMPNRDTIVSDIGGMNSDYPTVPLCKGNTLQITTPTVAGVQWLAMQPPNGYYSGSNYVGVPLTNVASSTGVTAGKILKGQSACGVTGTATSDATASASQILSNYTAYVNGSKVTGSMAHLSNNPDTRFTSDNNTPVLVCDALFAGNNTDGVTRTCFRYMGTEGYIHGNTLFGLDQSTVASSLALTPDVIKAGKVRCGVTGTFTSDATAHAGAILKDHTAYINGAKVVGTMPNYGGQTVGWCGYETVTVQPHPQDSSQALVTIPNQYTAYGYFDTASKITANISNLKASNIRAGVYVGRYTGNGADTTNCIVGTFTSDATARDNEIISGKTAYVNGSKVTGNIYLNPDMISGTNHIECSDVSTGVYTSGSAYNRLYIRPATQAGCRCAYDNDTWFTIPTDSLGITSDKILGGTSICGVSGGITNQGAYTDASSVGYSSGVMYVRIPKGAYVTGGSSGTGLPEIMTTDAQVRNAIGLTSAKIASGETVLGITGTGGSGGLGNLYTTTATTVYNPTLGLVPWSISGTLRNIYSGDITFTTSVNGYSNIILSCTGNGNMEGNSITSWYVQGYISNLGCSYMCKDTQYGYAYQPFSDSQRYRCVDNGNGTYTHTISIPFTVDNVVVSVVAWN